MLAGIDDVNVYYKIKIIKNRKKAAQNTKEPKIDQGMGKQFKNDEYKSKLLTEVRMQVVRNCAVDGIDLLKNI